MTGAEIALVVAASLVGSFIKSVTGMGYPLVAVPFLSLFIDVETAVTVVAVPNSVVNLVLCLDTRGRRSETRDLPILLVTSIAGAVVGTVVLVAAPDEPLLLALAFTVFVFVVQYFRNPELRLAPAMTRRWAPVAGTLAGFSQGAVGVSGPVVAMWFHGYRLSKDAYVFSITALFFVAGVAQVAVLIGGGHFDHDRTLAAGLAFVAAMAMIPLGTRLRARLGGVAFERAVVALLVVSGVSLVARAAA